MAIAIEWSTHGPRATAAKYDELLALLHADDHLVVDRPFFH